MSASSDWKSHPWINNASSEEPWQIGWTEAAIKGFVRVVDRVHHPLRGSRCLATSQRRSDSWMTLIFSAYWSPLTQKSIDGDEAGQRLASGAPLPFLVLGQCRSAMRAQRLPPQGSAFCPRRREPRRRLFDRRLLARDGGRFTSLPRSELAGIIWRALPSWMESRFGDEVARLEPEGEWVRVHFARTQAETFDLVIGADGLHSKVRELVFGRRTGSSLPRLCLRRIYCRRLRTAHDRYLRGLWSPGTAGVALLDA